MFVQFSDDKKTEIISIFGCAQDLEVCPNQGEVTEDDERYLSFIGRISTAPELLTTAGLIAAERYKREGVGITVDGSLIDTTRDGQALIAGAAVSAILDPGYKCNWKTATGFVQLTASQLVLIATAVRAHVQACFDRELELQSAVEAGAYCTEMLAEGWPDSPGPPEPELEPEDEPGTEDTQ